MTDTSVPQSQPETYYSGAYWGPRKESAEECARRTADFLNLLAQCDPFLAHWYKPARSRKDARQHPLMPPDVSSLTELFRRGVNRESGGPPIESLGYTFWFGNGGGDYDSADLRILCGGHDEAVLNSCVLKLPTLGRGANADGVLTSPVLTGAVRSMALAWEPDWAFATSHAYESQSQEPDSAPFSLGWITYLSRRLGTVPPLPAPVRIEPVEDKGTLIILTPERFTVKNPEHLALAEQVRGLLAKAGLMKPLAP
ncbi:MULTISPECIES: immunity 52 family protein [Corallococcus]|uniref:immunity 52 family protein n=1 Tax=Corallococcus TaxID=83461 RepID=UPI00226DCC68|nr:immunity 52 family protein [Corallococcus sp. BB11-1]MCY1037006.1 immunity 52 family protein [Corallococcus sp. BB11-1]